MDPGCTGSKLRGGCVVKRSCVCREKTVEWVGDPPLLQAGDVALKYISAMSYWLLMYRLMSKSMATVKSDCNGHWHAHNLNQIKLYFILSTSSCQSLHLGEVSSHSLHFTSLHFISIISLVTSLGRTSISPRSRVSSGGQSRMISGGRVNFINVKCRTERNP